MGATSRDINIFRVWTRLSDSWNKLQLKMGSELPDAEAEEFAADLKRFTVNGEDVRTTFYREFKDYFFSFEWAKNETEKEIASRFQAGVPFARIPALVGLKESAFRMKVARLTERINGLLFDGRQCPEGVYTLKDLEGINRCLVRLRLVRDPVDALQEFSMWQTNWIEAQAGPSEGWGVSSANMDKYFQAVLFLATVSRTFTLNCLDELEPSALGYAWRDMQSDGINSTKLLFSLLLKYLTPQDVSCDRALALAKHDYKEYTKR